LSSIIGSADVDVIPDVAVDGETTTVKVSRCIGVALNPFELDSGVNV